MSSLELPTEVLATGFDLLTKLLQFLSGAGLLEFLLPCAETKSGCTLPDTEWALVIRSCILPAMREFMWPVGTLRLRKTNISPKRIK